MVEYGGRRVIIVVGIMMGVVLPTLDATIVHVALPTIQGNIRASTQAQETCPLSHALHALPISKRC